MSKVNLRIFILGNFVSLLGSSMQRTALPLFILDLTGKGSVMSMLSLSHMIPMLLTTPISGVIGDRANRKHIMVSMDILRGLLLIPLIIFGFKGNLSLPLIFFIMALSAILDSFFSAATSAMLPELVAEDSLRKANSYHMLFANIANILGPVFGAIVYSVWGINSIFVFNALCYLISGIFELFIKYTPQKQTEKNTLKEFIASARFGFEFIHKNHQLKNFALFVLLLNFLIAPIFNVVIPFVTREELHLSSVAYGLLGTSLTIGIILGAIATGTILSKKPSGVLIKVGIFTFCCLTLLISALISPWLRPLFNNGIYTGTIFLLGLLVLLGIVVSTINIPVQTDMQKLTPNNVRSRVFASLDLLAQGAQPLSIAIGGIAIDYIPSYFISSIFALFLFMVGITFVKKLSDTGLDSTLEVEKV